MGSAGNQNPWAPYDSYKDCSLGICSVYCPQWCFYVLPPPPPDDPSDDDSGGPTFSPLIIAIIGILASAFLLVTYYTLITKYCRRRDTSSAADVEANRDQTSQDQWQTAAASSGLDETVIKSITVYKYRKGEGLVEGTECSVCLSEFQDDENLRLLPKCSHAFHLPCIDTWLKSHSNCPLCRANVASPLPPSPLLPQTSQNISALTPPPPTADPQTDLVLVVEDGDSHGEEGVVTFPQKGSCNGESSERGSTENGDEENNGVKQLRR